MSNDKIKTTPSKFWTHTDEDGRKTSIRLSSISAIHKDPRSQSFRLGIYTGSDPGAHWFSYKDKKSIDLAYKKLMQTLEEDGG